MRSILLSCSALALILSIAPASAMCGGGMNMGQQAQAPTTAGQGAMICGRPATSTQTEDPFGTKQAQSQKPQQGGMGMCPCCRGMAMMHSGSGTQAEDPHKGMDMSPKPQQ
jgi:hypothetical protein